jgi:hypothetical protein
MRFIALVHITLNTRLRLASARLQQSRDPNEIWIEFSGIIPSNPPDRGEKSDKCGIIAKSGEDVAWDEAWESLQAWE